MTSFMFGGYSGGSSTFTGKSSSGDGGNNFDLTGTTFCGDDLACYRDVIVNNVTKTSNDEITISLQYKSSQDLVGYQFVLAFDTSVVNPTAGATFTFTETTAAVNFLILEQLYDSGKFVILGSLTNLSNQIPSSSVATNFLDITINETGVFTAIEADIEDATSILKSNNNQNTLESPNPVFAYWNSTTSTEVKNNFWTGSGTGGSVPDPTGGSNIRLLIKELYGTPSIFDKDWAKELDTRLKGWYDVTDLCSIVIYALDTSITNLLVDYVCEEEMISSADCDGCDCPDELISLDNEECKSEVFISDTTITSLKDGSPAAIITLSYRSSCCIDGYDVILGNFKDRDGYDSTGGILEILNTQDQEPVQREWMEDVGFDPSLTFSEYYTNLTEQTLVYPRAFGFSFGNALNALAQSSDKNYGASERTGAWCIPSTNGGAKVLTRLLVNLDSFNGLPTIESFRLVTNEELVAPINDYGNNWTGIDLNESLGSDPLHTTVRYEDLQACLYYLKQGWGGSESGYPLNQSNAQIQSFISETGKTELDIADVLAVANHIVIEGNNQASNPAALIVPKDCCSCVLPSDFTVTTTYKNCLDPDNPGTILVEFDASSDADGYKIYRRSKKVINSTPSDFAVSRKLYENGNLTQEELLFTEFELIDVRTGISDGGTPSTNPIYDKPKLPSGCCDEVHTVEYVVVAFNKCGEISKQSTIENFQCCDETPTANNIEVTRPVNTKVNGFFPVEYAPAPAPFGTCTDAVDDCKKLTFIIRDVSVGGGSMNYAAINTGKFSYMPPNNYVGPVVITYDVYTETGCSDTGTITITFVPEEVKIDNKVFPCGSEDYGKVFLSWNNPTGNYSSFVVQRKLVPVSPPPIPYEYETIAELNFNDYNGLDNVTYVDESIIIDECCSGDVTYSYRVVVVGVVGESRTNLQFGGSDSRVYSTTSLETQATIPCCAVNNITNLAGTFLGCGVILGSTSGPAVILNWDEAVNSPETMYYLVYRKVQGESEFTAITKVVDDGSASFTYIDEDLSDCYGCGTSYTVDYAIVTVDRDQTPSGDPNSANWATGVAGDPCSEGGSTVQGAITCCVVTPCPENITVTICSNETKEVQLVSGCLVAGETVTYVKDPGQVSPPAAGLVTITTDGLATIVASEETIGTHQQDFIVASCGAGGYATLTVEIIDCGCYCADNEAEYIICDNDTYNADIANSPGKTVDQVPFSISIKRSHPKGSQEPYVLARGTVLCVKPT